MKFDSLFEEAAWYVFSIQKFSIPMIQKRFSIKYNRAASITDQLEVVGIIESYSEYGNRIVIVKDKDRLEQFLKNLLMF